MPAAFGPSPSLLSAGGSVGRGRPQSHFVEVGTARALGLPPGFVRCDPPSERKLALIILSTYIWPMDFTQSELVDDKQRSSVG